MRGRTEKYVEAPYSAILGFPWTVFSPTTIDFSSGHVLLSRRNGFEAQRGGVMAFSDSQILQGIAILIAGFTKIRGLTVYHWQFVCYMAWV